jgi:hypothetical protein
VEVGRGCDGQGIECTAQAFAEHLRQRPELLPTLLTTLFELVLFEECTNQWSLSRPMLSLILLNEQARVHACMGPWPGHSSNTVGVQL